MANELRAYLTPGKTLYAVLLNATGQARNGSAFETLAGANWTNYDIALTEAVAGVYLGNMPNVAAGSYSYVVYEQAGATAAVTDALRGLGSLDWDGSAEVGNSALATAIGAVPTAGEIDTQLSGTHGAGAWTAATGTGTGVYTDTVTDGSNPLDNVRVQLSTDVAGINRVYEATTNALGVFTMYPDPGTYYCWVDHARVRFPQGFQVVVT